jgi:hypothetical protein
MYATIMSRPLYQHPTPVLLQQMANLHSTVGVVLNIKAPMLH